MNAVIRLISEHASVRAFNDLPVTPDEEDAILSSAMRGATAGNMMQYHMIVIRDKETLRKLAASCDDQPFIGDAGLAVLFLADTYKWQRLFEARQVTDQGQPYSGPKIPDLMLAVQDAMIAAQNSVLAAESLGLGTCYIGDIMEQAEFHRALFHLPENTMPATLVVYGHYDTKPAPRRRFDRSFVVSREVYPDVDNAFIDSMFAPQEASQPDFAHKFHARKIEAAFFKEMIRSIRLYLSQWMKD